MALSLSLGSGTPSILRLLHYEEGDSLRLSYDPLEVQHPRYGSCWLSSGNSSQRCVVYSTLLTLVCEPKYIEIWINILFYDIQVYHRLKILQIQCSWHFECEPNSQTYECIYLLRWYESLLIPRVCASFYVLKVARWRRINTYRTIKGTKV